MKNVVPLLLIGLLVLGFYAGIQPVALTFDDLSSFGCWIWNESDSSYSFSESVYDLCLRAGNKSCWESVVVQQGVLPHGYTFVKSPLMSTFKVSSSFGDDALFLRVCSMLGGWGFYGGDPEIETYLGKNVSLIKVGVACYVKLNTMYEKADSKQLAVDELLFVAYKENGTTYVRARDEIFWKSSPTDPDFHAQYYDRRLHNDTWLDLTFDFGKRLRDALNHYGIGKGEVQAVQVYVEGVNAFCNYSVSHVDLSFSPIMAGSFVRRRGLMFGCFGACIALIWLIAERSWW